MRWINSSCQPESQTPAATVSDRSYGFCVVIVVITESDPLTPIKQEAKLCHINGPFHPYNLNRCVT